MLAPFLVPNLRDRGRAIEESWRRILSNPNNSLAAWVNKARDGRFPIVVFNASAVDNGKRMVISNVAIPKPNDRLQQGREAVKAVEFLKSCEGFDLSIATSARLSATFPYVSPICRPSANVKEPFHLADGGYVDNEGMVSALEWLRHLAQLRNAHEPGTSFDRVLFVRIVPFPPEAHEDTFTRLGWLDMASGPRCRPRGKPSSRNAPKSIIRSLSSETGSQPSRSHELASPHLGDGLRGLTKGAKRITPNVARAHFKLRYGNCRVYFSSVSP
jgi:hypothetical protein